MVYPEIIANRLKTLPHARQIANANAVGIGARLSCGSYVRFSLVIDVKTSVIVDAGFKSNGCGFMLAAADELAGNLIKQRLTDLQGLANDDLSGQFQIDSNSSDRRECIETCTQSLRCTFANFRSTLIEEFAGEKALICTCFGVTEERIETIIRENTIGSVDEISAKCNAGLGCGSCRMMIEEMIDSAQTHNLLSEI